MKGLFLGCFLFIFGLIATNFVVKYNKINEINPEKMEISLHKGYICGYNQGWQCTNFYQTEIGNILISF